MLQWFMAYFRLSESAVCEQSRGARDYHDYPDATYPTPMHFHTYECARCGKAFTI